MSNNRPFLSNFFAAFRAQSVLQKAATTSPASTGGTSTPSSYSHSQSTSTSTSTNPASSPRAITTKSSAPGATTAAVQATSHFQPSRQHFQSPSSPGSPGFPLGPPKQRRGSDSSSEGFREAIGSEKWYIGGRTTQGEERFYKLGMVKRHKSVDRLSLDRLSI